MKKIETLANKLLCNIKIEMEKVGGDKKNFFLNYYENDKPFFDQFIKSNRISKEKIEEVLKYCNANDLLKAVSLYAIKITDKGLAKAETLQEQKKHLPSWFICILEKILAPSIVAIVSSVITTIIMRKIGG